MIKFNLSFSLLHLSNILLLLLIVSALRIRNKIQLHYIYLLAIAFFFIWSLSDTFALYMYYIFDKQVNLFIYISNICSIIIPVLFLLFGLEFSNIEFKNFISYVYLWIIPCVSIVIFLTNNIHGLFFKKMTIFFGEAQYGIYYYIHLVYSYLCMFLGLFLLLRFSIRNSGFVSRQSLLIGFGSLLPLLIDVLVTTKIIVTDISLTVISLSFACVFIFYAIFKHDFLNTVPIALKRVVDHISDGFILLSRNLLVIDYNRPLLEIFGILNLERKKSVIDQSDKFLINSRELEECINKSMSQKSSVTIEKLIADKDFEKHLAIEITPIFFRKNNCGTVLLFKDITHHKKYIELLEHKNIQIEKKSSELKSTMEELESMNRNLTLLNNALKNAEQVAALDMQMAINVQSSILPKILPKLKDWEIAVFYKPMSGVSGDFYDFYTFDGSLAGVGVFDVSGHGISSGLVTMIAKTVITRFFKENISEKLPDVLSMINSELYKEIGNSQYYLTGILLRFNDDTVEYVNAAHRDLFIKSKEKAFPVRDKNGGPISGFILGLINSRHEYDCLEFPIERGEYFILYTDGLTESMDSSNKQYGENRLLEALNAAPCSSADEVLSFILDDFYSFVKGKDHLQDDLTVIVLKRL